jgi:hypothetical protein
VEAYCTRMAEFTAAIRTLYSEVAAFYPPTGPLTPTLAKLATAADTSPWSESATTNRAEALRLNIQARCARSGERGGGGGATGGAAAAGVAAGGALDAVGSAGGGDRVCACEPRCERRWVGGWVGSRQG